MKTNEQKFTVREWLERTLPNKGEWFFDYPQIVYAYNGETIGWPLPDAKPCPGFGYCGFTPITRSTAIDLMVAAIEGEQAGYLAKHQPCGCVVCTCESDRCQGCGATHCGKHPVGEIPNRIFAGDATEASDPYAHLPHGGWWVSREKYLFHYPNETNDGTRFTLLGDVHLGDDRGVVFPWKSMPGIGGTKLTRDQIIAIIEANKASKEPTPAPLAKDEPVKEAEKAIDPQLFELVKLVLPARAAMDSYDGMKWAEGIASDTMQIAKAMLAEMRGGE